MYVIKGRKMMLGLIKKEQKWEIALQTTLGFKSSGSCNRFKKKTDYGRPMKPFFIEIPIFWAWADNLDRQI